MEALGRYRKCISLLTFLVGVCFVAACNGAAAVNEARVWIDVPVDGLDVLVGQPVQIEGHAAHSSGVDHIEVWVNGGLHSVINNPPTQGRLTHFSQTWAPSESGEYTIQVVAIGSDGSGSAPDSVQVHVASEVVEAEAVVTPVPDEIEEDSPPLVPDEPTDTPTPVSPIAPPPPEAVIQFWADDDEIQAGSCTTLRWHVENVSAVFFDGVPTAGDGAEEICLCTAETHTLTARLADATEDSRSVTVNVDGSCVTEEPADTTAPDPPVQLKPTDGQSFSCIGGLMLRWNAASDPSDIAEYQIEMERHSGDNNWQSVANSPWSGLTGTELEYEATDGLECGWYYRWRIRAVDGAGNVGSYSGWFEFAVLLG